MEFGRVVIRVFVEPDESELRDPFVERICELVGFDLEEYRSEHPVGPIATKRFSLAIQPAQGFDGTIEIIEASLEAKKDAGALFDRLVSALSDEDVEFLQETVASRVDEEGHCYVRIDKLALLEDRFELVDHGRCVRFDFNVLTYPKSRDAAIEFVSSHVDAKAL